MSDGSPSLLQLVERVPAVLWEADVDAHRMVYVSRRARDLFGHDPEAWLSEPGFWEQHVHPDDLAQAALAVELAITEAATDLRIEYRFRTAAGPYAWVRDALGVTTLEDGERRLSGVMTDITGEREAQLAAIGTNPGAGQGPGHLPGLGGPSGLSALAGGLAAGLHQGIVDNLSDGVYVVDTDRRIRYWNRGAERITGFPAAAVIGRRCLDDVLVHVDAEGRSLCGSCPLSTALERGWERQQVTWLRHADGHRVPVLVRSSPVRLPGSTAIRAVVETFTDMTGIAYPRDGRASAPVRDPFADPDSGLPDRRLMDAVLRARKDDLDRYRLPFGLLVVEVDGFGALVNDHGSDLGQLVLRAVGGTLQGAVRNGDTVVRWGPAEFAIAISMADADSLQIVGERIRGMVRRTGAPIAGRRPLEVGVSIGGSLARAGERLEVLYARAELALAKARQGGHDRVVLVGSSAPTGGARMLGVRG